jgi:hypothetical protein
MGMTYSGVERRLTMRKPDFLRFGNIRLRPTGLVSKLFGGIRTCRRTDYSRRGSCSRRPIGTLRYNPATHLRGSPPHCARRHATGFIRRGDAETRDDVAQRTAALVEREPGVEFTVGGGAAHLTWANLETVRLNDYFMSVQLLFSRTSFPQAAGQFAFTKPNSWQNLKPPAGRNKLALTDERIRRSGFDCRRRRGRCQPGGLNRRHVAYEKEQPPHPEKPLTRCSTSLYTTSGAFARSAVAHIDTQSKTVVHIQFLRIPPYAS